MQTGDEVKANVYAKLAYVRKRFLQKVSVDAQSVDRLVLQVEATRTSVNRMNACNTVAFEAFTRESVRTCTSITVAPDDPRSHVFSL